MVTRIQLMGRPCLHRDGQDLSKYIKYRKAWALLGYLAAAPGQWFSRQFLADLLWPELDSAAARTNLRQVLSNIASVLEPATADSCLERDADAVRWQATTAVEVDIDWLNSQTLARAGSSDADSQAWLHRSLEPLCSRLIHPFLQGMEQLQAQDYQEWLSSMREMYASRVALLLEQLLQQQRREGRLADATELARSLVTLAPAEAGYTVLLMELLHMQGLRAEMELAYESCNSYFRAQLGKALPTAVLTCRTTLLQSPSEVQRLAAEWRWVCALYCETSEVAAPDEEDWEFLQQQWGGVVTRFGGQVVSMPGNGWLAIFGLAGAGESVALRAVLAAQEWRTTAKNPNMQFGIADGKLLHSPGAVHRLAGGEVVKLAMGICWAARPGQAFLTQGAAAQVGHGARFISAEIHHFPGVSVACQLLRWNDSPEESPTAIGQSSTRQVFPLVGRAQALRQLSGVWRQVQTGTSAVHIIQAPAGYGKTRLASELLILAEFSGGQSVRVACRLEAQHQPLNPFFTALHISSHSQLVAAQGKSEIFSAVIAALFRRLVKGPLLLWVDDIHWADQATLEFLPVLVQALADKPVLFLIASRPGQHWAPPTQAVIMELPALGVDDAAALVRSHGGQLDTGTCERILAVAGGVPLFLELLTHAATSAEVMHPSISSVLQAELDGLGVGKRVLRAAAVIGIRFSAKQLADLIPTDEVADALQKAETSRLVEHLGDGMWCFHHALIYDAVYESVPVNMRSQWHMLLARRLQLQGAASEEIAQHWSSARAWKEALLCWRQAGDDALTREFAADALVCFQRAMEMNQKIDISVRDVWQDAQLRLRMGYALQMVEGFGSKQSWQYFYGVVQQAESMRSGAPEWHDVLFAALSGSFMGGSSQGRLDGLDIAYRLTRLAESAPQHLMAEGALGNALFWRGNFSQACHHLEKAIVLADSLPLAQRTVYCIDDPALICRAFLAWAYWFQGKTVEASTMVEAALAEAAGGQRVHSICFGLSLLMGVYWCQGKYDAQGNLAKRTLELAQKFQFPLWQSVGSLFLLCSEARAGRLLDTQPLFVAAQQVQAAYQAGITTSRWLVADALVALGEWSQALTLLELSISEAGLHEDQYCLADLVWLKAECQQAMGQDPEPVYAQARAMAAKSGARGLMQRYARSST